MRQRTLFHVRMFFFYVLLKHGLQALAAMLVGGNGVMKTELGVAGRALALHGLVVRREPGDE